jgi:hypothetical protein
MLTTYSNSIYIKINLTVENDFIVPEKKTKFYLSFIKNGTEIRYTISKLENLKT